MPEDANEGVPDDGSGVVVPVEIDGLAQAGVVCGMALMTTAAGVAALDRPVRVDDPMVDGPKAGR
jgi:hypothetical protein